MVYSARLGDIYVHTLSLFIPYPFPSLSLLCPSLFWSSLVTSINDLAATADLPQYQQQYLSVLIVLVCLLVLPFIFDFLARYYEGIKLESEIQATIMTRYFWYQLINVYVTVGFGGVQIVTQVTDPLPTIPCCILAVYITPRPMIPLSYN